MSSNVKQMVEQGDVLHWCDGSSSALCMAEFERRRETFASRVLCGVIGVILT